MNFQGPDDGQQEFQIAPMIDIVFLLLVFFIVSYSMAQIEREMGIQLPRAETATEQSSRRNEVVVNLGPEGDLIVNRQAMQYDELQRRLQRLAQFGGAPDVIIRADENCPHGYVIRVMDVCQKADVTNIFFRARLEERHGPVR